MRKPVSFLQHNVAVGLVIFLVLASSSTTTSHIRVSALSSAAVVDTARIARMQNKEEKRPQVSFSHVHLYVDELKDLDVYKDLEARLNRFVDDCESPLGKDIPVQQAL